jgi:predicted  nucleic acid-binding Zn-ribbon protein
MSTYDPKRVLSDWSNGTLTADMAIGHSLQHITALYKELAEANGVQRKLQDKVSHLENSVKTLQTQLDRLVKSASQKLELERIKSPTPN